MAVPNSNFKRWLTTTLDAEPEYPYTHECKITNDIKIKVHKQFGYDPEIHLLVKDSVSICFGEYVCDLSGRTPDEVESVVESFYEDVQLHGLDTAISLNCSLWR